MTGEIQVHGPRFAMLPEWVLYHPDLTGNAVRVYCALLRFGSTPDRCFPSHKRVGELCGVSARTVPKLIGELVDAGAVRVVARFKDGAQTSNGYEVFAGENGPGCVPVPDADEDIPPTRENVPPHALTRTPPTRERVPPLRADARRTKAIEREQVKENTLVSVPDTTVSSIRVPAWKSDDEFLWFKATYPKERFLPSPSAVYTAWEKEKKRANAAAIIAGVERWVKYWAESQTQIQFIPHAKTWLSDHRWESDDTDARPVSTTGAAEFQADLDAEYARNVFGEPF